MNTQVIEIIPYESKVCCIVSTVAADVLMTQEARSSAAIISTQFSWNILASSQGVLVSILQNEIMYNNIQNISGCTLYMSLISWQKLNILF